MRVNWALVSWFVVAAFGFIGTALPREIGVLHISAAMLTLGAFRTGQEWSRRVIGEEG